MSTNSEKINEHSEKIVSLECEVNTAKERATECKTETRKQIEENKENIALLDKKVNKELEDIENHYEDRVRDLEDRTSNNENSINLIAKEVRDLMIIKNKINAKVWQIIIAITVMTLFFVLLSNGPEFLEWAKKLALK
jgi:hypothetical protein